MRTYARTALLALFVFLLVGGLAMARWELVAATIPLVVSLFLETQHRFPTRMDLEAKVELGSTEVMVGDEVDLRLRLENRGPDIYAAEADLTIDPGLQLVSGHSYFPLTLRTGGSTVISWRVTVVNKGRFGPGSLTVSVRDAFHLFERSVTIPLTGLLRAAPRVEHLKKVDLRPSVLRPFAGNLRSGVAGTGTEFHCLREYRSGDPLRRINWKASARRDELIANQMEDERSGDLVIVLDLQGVGRRLRDRSVEAAASVGYYWLGGKNRVGMVVLGDFVEVVPMGMGRRQFHLLVEKLMEVRESDRSTVLYVDKVWKRHFPPQALVVFISPLTEEGVSSTVKRLVRQGAKVLLLSPREEREREERVERLVDRLDKVRRDDLLYVLGDFCRVVEWDIELPLSRSLSGVRNW